MSWTKVIKAEQNVSIDEIANKLVEIWNKKDNDKEFDKEISSTLDYLKYFKDVYNLKITADDLDEAWDIAIDKRGIEEIDEDEQPLEINGMIFETVEDANNWLNEKLHEYGNTYHFPEEDNDILNKLIEKFGSTYFWDK